jgi:hypothetical protein
VNEAKVKGSGNDLSLELKGIPLRMSTMKLTARVRLWCWRS